MKRVTKKRQVVTPTVKKVVKTIEPKKDYTLSVIIPCYNLEKWIEPCLDSLLEQTNLMKINREVIFICDSCTDRTREIIEEKTKDNSAWDYIIKETSVHCPGGARNVGLDIAKGKYIWFIDGDDWLTDPRAVDILVDCMLKDDMDIVEFKIKSKANPDGVFGSGTVWRAMLSRRIIGNERFNDRQNGEDNDFSWNIWHKEGRKYGKVALAPYFYNYPREGSQSDIAYHTVKK
jgi:glycosyltransferase involved in cell wall biosynthesis